MAKYVCVAGEVRDYSKLGKVAPGDVVEADENPDGAFFMQAAENAPAGVNLVGGFEAVPADIVDDAPLEEPVEAPPKAKRARKSKDGDV